MKLKKILLIVIILIIISSLSLFILYNNNDTSTIGSDDTGHVIKTVYNHYNSNVTIAIITGIHPRETLAINPEIEAAKVFAFFNNVKVVNYNVVVEKDSSDYNLSRTNGEHLVSNYVVCDIYNSNADVVIISHSHIPTYGEGFYVATPEMDQKSVDLAQKIQSGGINFNYYPNNGKSSYNSSSAVLVSKPLAISGYPTLVYEIPENITENDAYQNTYNLMKFCLDYLNNLS
ncbi:MAG: hypothetical protein Q4Q23_03445 [Methanobacteriaceae archaeon]|nr:hypothetical protein [Methanobacteriaceae archaeon]